MFCQHHGHGTALGLQQDMRTHTCSALRRRLRQCCWLPVLMPGTAGRVTRQFGSDRAKRQLEQRLAAGVNVDTLGSPAAFARLLDEAANKAHAKGTSRVRTSSVHAWRAGSSPGGGGCLSLPCSCPCCRAPQQAQAEIVTGVSTTSAGCAGSASCRRPVQRVTCMHLRLAGVYVAQPASTCTPSRTHTVATRQLLEGAEQTSTRPAGGGGSAA